MVKRCQRGARERNNMARAVAFGRFAPHQTRHLQVIEPRCQRIAVHAEALDMMLETLSAMKCLVQDDRHPAIAQHPSCSADGNRGSGSAQEPSLELVARPIA